MSYELFEQGPATYIPVILVSLIITLVLYGAFPVIFAKTRKKIITKRKYRVICYCFNFLMWFLSGVIGGEFSSGGAYFLWTWVFSAWGVSILEGQGVLEGFQPVHNTEPAMHSESSIACAVAAEGTSITADALSASEEKSSIKHCSNCGSELIAGSVFCSNCGTAVEESPADDHVLEDFAKFTADMVTENIAANSNIPSPTSTDLEYGLVPSKPIYTAFIDGQQEYLGSLRTLGGESITWERLGSTAVEGINGMIDIYETYLPSGELYKTLYLNMYSTKTSAIPPAGFSISNPTKAKDSPATIPASMPVKSTRKQRFCKFCGGTIDHESKKCTSCGKQYFKLPKIQSKAFLAVIVVLFILLCTGGFFGFNYYKGIDAMHNQRFIVAQQYFDNLQVGDRLFPNEYAYIKAGVLKEEGKYIEALNAFSALEGIPVPVSITDSLKADIYSIGQSTYRLGKNSDAKKYFTVIPGYKRSDDYLQLISCKIGGTYISQAKFNGLVNLIGFEDADEIILNSPSALGDFLSGRWETAGSPHYYFEIDEEESASYSLPRNHSGGTYHFSNGIYKITEKNKTSSINVFKFSIVNKDSISIYCYKDGKTYKLYRQ